MPVKTGIVEGGEENAASCRSCCPTQSTRHRQQTIGLSTLVWSYKLVSVGQKPLRQHLGNYRGTDSVPAGCTAVWEIEQ